MSADGEGVAALPPHSAEGSALPLALSNELEAAPPVVRRSLKKEVQVRKGRAFPHGWRQSRVGSLSGLSKTQSPCAWVAAKPKPHQLGLRSTHQSLHPRGLTASEVFAVTVWMPRQTSTCQCDRPHRQQRRWAGRARNSTCRTPGLPSPSMYVRRPSSNLRLMDQPL